MPVTTAPELELSDAECAALADAMAYWTLPHAAPDWTCRGGDIFGAQLCALDGPMELYAMRYVLAGTPLADAR